jgi:hypothetical protein
MKYEEDLLFNENGLGTPKIPLFKENQSALKEGERYVGQSSLSLNKVEGGKTQEGVHVFEGVCDNYSKLDEKEVEKGYISKNLGMSQKSSGNFLTMANVEEKMKSNNFGDNIERRRASDNTLA